MKEWAIQLSNITKVYKGKKAVDGLSLNVEKGSVVALLGPNGAGKTTTVSMILGLIQPTSGSVKLLGGDPKDRSVRDRIGAMLQDVSVIDNLTVAETIDLFRHYYKTPLPLEQLLQISGLTNERSKMASTLSGGQQRRLGFAMAVAGDPEVLFLDEPTVGMDVTSRQLFWDTVKAMAGRGRTIVLTTHYLEEADQVADRIVVINDGKLAADGTPSQIKATTIGRTITFTAGSTVTNDHLYEIPGVTDAEWNGRRVRLYSNDTDRLIAELITRGVEMKDIEIQSGGLEEAFRSLVSSAKEDQ
ncbi:ABC-2 type transport system ATP-binding protein [Paenibacillus cellulosilyticus]|uniref:ABC-2 type transport system ATP-binding protein n=1 Tax=Paenibacillus cellulosilyticus TaxID=375489 RepID=A0A2V2Z077_9BACL|nr:ABC transporter ATP-binding protein [Paenibacillus cellulosilyticus]PWW05598.1 ABC-2 type transport system ATP-binding protein [Paenibacillus cellulosilyticus]QKS45370.1 ABC transporter ATP-binding protein [Paenibacillus cellulosilyticus]